MHIGSAHPRRVLRGSPIFLTKLSFLPMPQKMKNKALQAALFSIFMWAIWFCLFFLYLSVSGFSPDSSFVFSCVFAAAHAGEFALVFLLITLLLSFLPQRAWAALCVLLGAGVTLFLLANFFVYRQFRLHIDMAMLSMFFGEAGSDIFVFPPIMYVQAVLFTAAVAAVAVLAWFMGQRQARSGPKPWLKRSYICILLCIVVFHGVHAWARFNMYSPVTRQVSMLPLVQPLSMTSLFKKMGFEQAKDLPRFAAKSMNYPLEELAFVAPDKKLNLVVIMLDGWRFDSMTEEITPNIYEFSRRCQRFMRHNASSNHTRHGVFSFYYGLPGMYWDSVLADKISPVLMDAVLDAGYATAVFGSSSLASPEFDQTVFTRVKDLDLNTDGKGAPAKDVEITNKFMRFLDARDKSVPFFSFIFYDSTHAYQYDAELSPPIFLPEMDKNYLASTDDEKLKILFNRYKNTVRYSDVLVRRVLERLEKDSLLEDTVVIISSDHGEEFDDLGLGYMGHNGNFSDHQVHVPMLVYWPGRGAAEHGYETSHLDLAPTLMQEIFGCTSPEEAYSSGVNLFLPEPRKYMFMMGPSGSYGIRIGEHITAFPPVGPSYSVSAHDYRPVSWRLPPDIYRDILYDLSRFK